MSSVQVALVLLGAFWAGTNVVFTGLKLLVEAKNRIIVGKANGEALPADARRRVLVYDWLPVRMGLAALSLTLAVIIMYLPTLADGTDVTLRSVCWVTVVVPVCGFLNFAVGGVVEWKYLRTFLR